MILHMASIVVVVVTPVMMVIVYDHNATTTPSAVHARQHAHFHGHHSPHHHAGHHGSTSTHTHPGRRVSVTIAILLVRVRVDNSRDYCCGGSLSTCSRRCRCLCASWSRLHQWLTSGTNYRAAIRTQYRNHDLLLSRGHWCWHHKYLSVWAVDWHAIRTELGYHSLLRGHTILTRKRWRLYRCNLLSGGSLVVLLLSHS